MGNFTCFYDGHWDCRLPVTGSDNDIFIHMGIEFGPFSEKDVFRDVKLPDGWKKIPSNTKYWYNIVDSYDSIRIHSFEKVNPFMYPVRRFNTYQDDKDTSITYKVLDGKVPVGNENVVIFEKQVSLPSKSSTPNAYKQRKIEYDRNSPAVCWLNKHLPKWDDCSAYWQDGEIIVDSDEVRFVKGDKNESDR